MTEKPSLEWQKREISAALDGIIAGEKAFKEQHGIEIADEDEWRQVGEFLDGITARWNRNPSMEEAK